MEIILMSDSHSNTESIEIVRKKFPNADCLIHCGDSDSQVHKLKGFVAVRGNTDKAGIFPDEQILNIGSLKILITHGDKYTSGWNPDYKAIARAAKEQNCSCVFFGHTHIYCDKMIDGVRLLNPGSTWKSRDGISPASIMRITINNDRLSAERINYVTLMY